MCPSVWEIYRMLKTYLICGAMSVSDRLLHELARVGGFIPLNIGAALVTCEVLSID